MLEFVSRALVAALQVCGQAPSERPAGPSWKTVDDEIVRLVREHFFDPTKAEAWAEKNRDFAEKITEPAEFARVANRLLDRLGASHTHYYTADDAGYCELRSIFAETLGLAKVECESIGADVDEDGRVRRVFGGGPADKAKIVSGDRLVHPNGFPFHPVRSVRGLAGETLALHVDRGTDFSTDVVVGVRRIDPKAEWLAAQGADARVFVRDDRGVGYVPMFSCAGEEYVDKLRESFVRDLGEAEGLIIDLRAGWGGCNPDFVDLFSKTPAELWFLDRDKHCENVDRQWRKPVVFLIDGGSRSGKEIVAYSVKKHRIGKLVGERTAGAVLGGQVFPLSDGSILYLAVKDVQVDGERLEGVGVKPDVEVDDSRQYIGHDPQLDAALNLMFAELGKTKPAESACPSGHHHEH